jgi:hypothetical protein
MAFAKFAKTNATIQLFPLKTTTILTITTTATRRTTMTFEFRLIGTFFDRPQYRVFRIGHYHSLGFVSVLQSDSAYHFFANSSAVLSQVDLEEIAEFIEKENYRNDPERSSRAMIELETLPPTGRFHGNR